MFPKLALGLMAGLLLALLVGCVALAADKSHEGIVVSAENGKLVMNNKDGRNQHTHMVPATTKVTLNDKSAMLTGLKKGDAVKVTKNAQSVVITIAATRS